MVLYSRYVPNCLYQTISWAKTLLVLVLIIFVSIYVYNKKKGILRVGEGTAQGLDDTKITTKAK